MLADVYTAMYTYLHKNSLYVVAMLAGVCLRNWYRMYTYIGMLLFSLPIDKEQG